MVGWMFNIMSQSVMTRLECDLRHERNFACLEPCTYEGVSTLTGPHTVTGHKTYEGVCPP